MARTYYHTTCITRDPELPEIEIEIEYTATGGYPGHGPSWNDPGSPPEAPEIEIMSICDMAGKKFKLTELELENVYQEIMEHHEDDSADYYEDY